MRNPAKPSFIEQPRMKDDKQLAGSHQAPVKVFKGHRKKINSIATFPDGKRIATGSHDKTIRIWRLEDGTEMKKWAVKKFIGDLKILRNGKHVVSAEGEEPDWGDDGKENPWKLWVRDAETGKVVAGPLDGHTHEVWTLDISPDGGILASGSTDRTVILWDTDTWQKKGEPIFCGTYVICVRFSPTGQLGIATDQDIQIWDVARRERLAQFKGHNNFNNAWNMSLTWTRDGAHLLSAGDKDDPVIRSWDTSAWKQAGDPWTGHDNNKTIQYITLNPAGTLLASASVDHTVRLWQLPTGTEVARFRHSDAVILGAFSVNGRSIFSGGNDKKMSKWEIPEQVLAAVQSDSLGENNEAGPSSHKKRNIKRLLDNTRPESPSSSCLDADATGGDGIIKEEYDNPYNDNFFQSQPSLPLASAGLHQSRAHRFWNVISRNRQPANESIPLECPNRGFFGRRTRSNSLPEPATVTPTQATPEVKVRAGKEDEHGEMDDDCSTNAQPGASKRCKGKEPDGSLVDAQSLLPGDSAHPAELNSEENRNLWSRLMHARGKDPTSVKMAPATKRPEVVEVYAVRGFQGHVALTLKRKKKSSAVTCSAPFAAAHASGSLPTGPSSQGGPVQPSMLSQAASGQGGPSSPPIVGHGTQSLQATAGPSSQASPSHFVTGYHTSHGSYSCSSIEGSFNRFLDKICFPCGHYHDDD